MSFFEVLSPQFLLFPALLGSAILALVCPLVGAHLILRRRIFLGLTLPQVAACGVAFTFWVYHGAGQSHGAAERLLAMGGSLVFTLAGMGLLAYLDRHATGSPEGRLAAAYALASALTILFIVFNPSGELEILNLLKGEVISLTSGELKLLAFVFGLVLIGLVLFRREFLLTSFDRDLAFLLTGGHVQWNGLLYVLCGLCIAVGVIMAGPMLVFGFMVLPPLAARAVARGMNSFFCLSAILGLLTAIFGFYFSVRLDLPLGPTDVVFGCAVIFVIYGVQLVLRKTRGAVAALLVAALFIAGCATQSAQHALDWQNLRQSPVWLASVRNSTASDLRLPSTNPLRSIAEWAGKVAPDYRPTVPDILRGTLRKELEQRKIAVSLPEDRDLRLQSFPFDAPSAAANARSADLRGWLLLSEIRRWQTDDRSPLRARVDFKLVRTDNGAVAWERQVNKTIPIAGSGRLDELTADAVREVLRDVFGSP